MARFSEVPVGTVHDHSKNSLLLPPRPATLEKLARQAKRGRFGPQPAPKPDEPRSLKRRLDAQTWQEIAAKYEAGATTPALCIEYGLSKGGILRILRDQHIELRRQPLTSDQVAEAVRLYGYGFSIAAIADHLDTSFNNVRQNLERLGVERRPRGGSAKKTTADRPASLTDEQRISAVLLYTAGGSLPAVSAAVGVSEDRVRRCLADFDVPIRPKGRPPRHSPDNEVENVVSFTAPHNVTEGA